MKSIERSGMTVRWQLDDACATFEMHAPTHGWLAVGFNTHDVLAGTHLIMGAVKDGLVAVSDRAIIAPGDHRARSDLKLASHLTKPDGQEDARGTTVRFSLPLGKTDRYMHPLYAGNSYVMLMAYSQEDDFLHHSLMRTSVTIGL